MSLFPVFCPKVTPAATISFRSPVNTSTANATSYTFTAADIGTANANRVVVVAIGWDGTSGVTPTVTVAGNTMTNLQVGSTGIGGFAALYYLALATGTTGDIIVSGVTGGLRMSAAVWAVVPGSGPTPITSGIASGGGGTDTVISLPVSPNQVLVAFNYCDGVGVTHAETWGGSDTVNERADATLEGAAGYGACDITLTQSGTFSFTFVDAGSNSSGGHACAATWR